ncbi:hypothetical protein phiAS5_ORF0261 [Aeromonas phage phiAS5]|uniref:Uncharacterized protein n=1 Tax=Aeromonas phage phiAS5 TaxID=879630 RepID=E1A215_9CAUD|nr:membrane protein [Aeromonas phage phiAS5]ADM80104.1 hypothetical protein phiAS5_ORF0261 [Aeromonas phage phiAS5]
MAMIAIMIIEELPKFIRVSRDMHSINMVITRTGIQLERVNVVQFVFKSSTRTSRPLLASEVYSFWKACDKGANFEQHSTPIEE